MWCPIHSGYSLETYEGRAHQSHGPSAETRQLAIPGNIRLQRHESNNQRGSQILTQ